MFPPRRRLSVPAAAVVVLLFAVSIPAAVAEAPSSLRVEGPRLALSSMPSTCTVHFDPAPAGPVDVEIRDASGRLLRIERGVAAGEATLELPPLSSGRHDLTVGVAGREAVTIQVRVVPSWLSLAPPFLAIVLALVFRQVVPSLLAGIWLGAWIADGNPMVAVLRTLDRYVLGSLTDADHMSIIVFSMLLGGMVGVLARSGGTQGLVDALAARATTSARGQVVTWLLGVAVFFDDYANTLVVGNTMRPVTDRLRISREKLAYIVDSTAAPVAAIGIISTWIGYEVSLIGDALEAVGSELDAYGVFLQSIPYNFYPVLALVFGLLVASTRRDFGPMLAAERRAAGGRLLRDGAVPLADFEGEALSPVPGKPRRWINAVAPVVSVLVVTFLAQWLTGRAALAADGDALATASWGQLGFQGVGQVFAAGNSFRALLYASAAGCLVAILLARFQGILTIPSGLAAWLQGMKSMLLAFVILTLAWSIAQVCVDLHTSDFVVSALSGNVDPRVLPTLVFLFAAVIAFATGTSWATMGILVPLAVPAAFGVAQAAGFSPEAAHRVFLGAVAAVLAGAIFGDHCSPISDTTVLSSMSSGCDHVDHVRTQLPYALVVAGIAVAIGYLPVGFGLPAWAGLAIGTAALAAVLRFAGRRADH